jgi:hypothetical protein
MEKIPLRFIFVVLFIRRGRHKGQIEGLDGLNSLSEKKKKKK